MIDSTVSPLSAKACSEGEFYQSEQREIFNKSWILAGFFRDLSEHEQYVTFEFSGCSIVIMNFEGELHAFRNVCSHRFSRICEGKGKGHLQCPYHGWTYNDKGEPYAVPAVRGFKDLDRKKLALARYAVAVCGEFVFINLDNSAQHLERHLGAYYHELEKVSLALGESLDCNDMLIQANWKVVVENTLEHYHVRKVHPNSLNAVGIKSVEFTYDRPHSSAEMLFKTKLDKSSAVAELYEDRPLKVEDYVHHFIFPCMTVATAYGTTIAIQQIIPCAHNQTRFISHVFGTKLEQTKNALLVEHFNKMAVDFNRRVFDEDKHICEQVQLGLNEMGDAKSLLHRDEERIAFFQATCKEYINQGNSGE